MDSQEGLNIIVVGAGIAGLSAGIALRKVGHKVTIYERSDLHNEFGAAIHMSPNASRVLISWGLDPVRARFVAAKTSLIANGVTLEKIYQSSYDDVEERFGAPWYLTHRVDLHEELKRMAADPGAAGTPVEIKPNCKVVRYDTDTGSITLADGTTHTGDLVIAADGVHSDASEIVLGAKNTPLTTEQSTFRLLIPSSVLAADPETAGFLVGDDGRFKAYMGEGKRIVWYPCRNNEVQNMAAIFVDKEGGLHDDWNAAVGQNDLVEKFKEFHPSLVAVLKKAKDVKKWPLLFRTPITNWYRGKLVLVGDAAHPMLPLQGQAGAQAIEDAVAISVMLRDVTFDELKSKPSLLSERLQLFQKVRSDRAAAMQIFSNTGQTTKEGDGVEEQVRQYLKPGEKVPRNPHEFMEFNFGHDVAMESEKVLRQWQEEKK